MSLSVDTWPDAGEGLARLRRRFTTATLSNAGMAAVVAVVKHANLPFDAILTAELAKSYKPAPAVYQLAVERGAFADEGTESGGASLVHIDMPTRRHTEQVQPPLGKRQWAEQLVREVADGMAGSVFDATENDYCRMCAVASSCPIKSPQVTEE